MVIRMLQKSGLDHRCTRFRFSSNWSLMELALGALSALSIYTIGPAESRLADCQRNLIYVTVLLGTACETAKVTRHGLTNGKSSDATVPFGHEVTVVRYVVVIFEPCDLGMIAADETFQCEFMFDDVIRFYT